jgi:hypothetical protein
MVSANAPIHVDGKLGEPAWYMSGNMDIVLAGAKDVTATFNTSWDENYLYIGARVLDSALYNDSTNMWDDDSVEIYIDADHNQGTTYDSHDRQFILGYNDSAIFSNQSTTGVLHGWSAINGGYTVEMAVPWSNLGVTPSAGGTVIGFDVNANDDKNGGARDSHLAWAGNNDNFRDTSGFGDLTLSGRTGDTYPGTKMVYPSGVFHPNNYAGTDKRVIDVTAAPFNAVPDDGQDDTDAIIEAYEFVLDELHDGGWVGNGGIPADMDKSYIIYFPEGTYNVDDTIIYSQADRQHPNLAVDEELAMIRFIGESREKSKIVLSSNNPNFQDANNPKPVLSFGKRDFNNLVSSNSVRNLTIDVGAGNPGAIGIKFGGANTADIYNVSILAGSGSGFVGLDDSIGTVVGYQSNIFVRGFKYGIRMNPFHFTYPVLEHITLRQQSEAGILFENGMGAIRDLWSDNGVPAVIANQSGSHAIVTDSTLWNGDSANPAIDAPAGHLFAKNIDIDGYGMGVRKNGSQVVAADVTEYVSDGVTRFNTSMPTASMDLTIEEVPPMNWETDLNKWANVDSYPGANDTAKIQNAMNDTTKTVVYFPKGTYTLTSTVTIPDHVKMVNFLFGEVTGTVPVKFQTTGTSSTPLWIMDGSFTGSASEANIKQNSSRTLVLQSLRGKGGTLYKNVYTGTGGNKLFVNSSTGIKPPTVMSNQQAWFRFVNTEYKTAPNFEIGSSAAVWVMGYKTEGAETNFKVDSGGVLQILGGFGNMWTSDPYDSTPMYESSNGNISIVTATNGQTNNTADYYTNIIKDTVSGTTKTFMWDDFPHRANPANPSVGHSIIIPLYNSYDPNDIP